MLSQCETMKITEYPDGQISVTLKDSGYFTHRINSYKDLFVLKSIAEAHHYAYPNEEIHVYIPCLFGQLSDRRFGPKSSFDLKIICEFINSCKFNTVTILDPHSYVGPALINNCHVVQPDYYIDGAIDHYDFMSQDFVLVSPDAVAYKKVFSFAETRGLPLVAANKFRGPKGQVSISIQGDVKGATCLIINDLVVGGYTFHQLGAQLKEQGAASVYLYVTHGFFFKGFDVLQTHIDGIVTTDSVSTITHPFVFQQKII